MNKQVDKSNKGLKHEFVATVKQHGPELWNSFRRSWAEDLLEEMQEEYLYLAGCALLDSGANHEKASRLIAKHWEITVRDAEIIVKEAQESIDLEKKHNADPKAVRKTNQSKKPRT